MKSIFIKKDTNLTFECFKCQIFLVCKEDFSMRYTMLID